jgi:hypothetical protein
VLRSALDHYRRQQRITALGLIAARLVRFDTLDRLLATTAAFQLNAAQDAAAAVPLMLAEQGIETGSVATSVLPRLLGVASDGRSLAGLLDYTRSPEVTADQFDRIVATQLQDVAREAASIEIAVRPQITGWTRVLNPPSCSRCVILAGRVYRWSDGFQRHPRCDCRHVPIGESAVGLTVGPKDYFDSLSEADQNSTFTVDGAQAIRLGADPAKVVNARRGMARAQVYGRDMRTTTEGTARARRNATPRLMPESILEIAQNDRKEAVRLLTRFGYVQ